MAAERTTRTETTIETRTMRTAITTRTPHGRRHRLLLLAAATCLLLGLAPAMASATVTWRVTSAHGPQNIAPGGTGQYVIMPYNLGDTPSSGTITITDILPAGFTATGVVGSAWTCTTRFPATGVVTCRSSVSVTAPGTDALARGAGAPLYLNVTAGSTEGTFDNTVTISGGGGGGASVTDPTPVSGTPAGFGFATFASDFFDGPLATSAPVRQAGAHPFEMRVDFTTNLRLGEDPDDPTSGDLFYTAPDETIKNLETRLPVGMIGDPQSTPQCAGELTNETGRGGKGFCPPNTQVGTIDLVLSREKQLSLSPDLTMDIPVYNMKPPPGVVAALGFSYVKNPVWILVTLDPSDHYSIVATLRDTIELLPVRRAELSLWGVPADPAHDALRMDARAPQGLEMGQPFTGAPIKPFLALPTTCGVDGALRVRADSWFHPGVFTPWLSGTVAQMTGCDDPRFKFQPTISVRPEQTTASTPTGLDVDLSVPQKDATVADARDLYAGSGNDAAIPTPPLRTAVVTLPAGMAVSPSSADGLAACTPLQIGLGANDAPTCPDASKLGTVTIDTPVLPDPLRGNIYLATQNDNPFGTTLAIYLVASGPGVVVKLPGKVEPDATTGQLATTFDDNPPLPFSHLNVHFIGGSRAPLVTPPTCGVKTTSATLSPWNLQLPAVQTTSDFTIDGNCTRGFDPGFTAGTSTTAAGKDASLVTRFTRSDSDEELSGIDVSLPPGVLGTIKNVDLCGDAAANAGTCGDGSLIGRTTVGAGPGPNPFFITDGRVYMTGPYKGAPFGLSIVVHAKAGPLDLGNVVVRAQAQVDRQTAVLRVVSDPLPTILAGIPLEMRMVDVTVDRPHFTFNPTSCAQKQSTATLTSTGGKTSTKSSRFEVDGCKALPFRPKLTIQVGARHRTQRGASTPLKATVQMTPGQTNLRYVKVVLPTTLNARLPVINQACTLDQFHASKCERARAGSAVAYTPLLRDPLKGGVYFVRNGKPLPDMMVALRGQVAVDLDSRITIPGGTHLSTVFDTIPDVPISRFTLSFVAGKQGPLGAARNLCTTASRSDQMGLSFIAQNGKSVYRSQRLVVKGCPKARKPAHKKARKKAHKSTGGTAQER